MPNVESVELGSKGDRLRITDYCGDEEIVRESGDGIIFMCTNIKEPLTQQRILKLLSNVSATNIPVLILENKCDGLDQEEMDLIEDYEAYVREKEKQRRTYAGAEYRWLLGGGSRISYRQISCYSQGGLWESLSWLVNQLSTT